MNTSEKQKHPRVSYTDRLENISAEKLEGFFAGWPNPPSAERHLELLKNSAEIVLAIDDKTGRIVGFITAITDKILCAYIPFLEVLPEYQGLGIGLELTRRMMGKLSKFYMVDLLCDRELEPFYARAGMKPAHAMMLRNYERQSGGG